MQSLVSKKTSTNIIQIDNQLFETLDLINERNKEIKSLEEDLVALRDSMEILATMIDDQGEKLDIAEKNIEETVITTQEAVQIIEQISDKRDILIRNVKIVSGVIIGGALLGGIGSIFGIIPAIVGAGVGSSGGAVIGFVSDLLKNK